MYFTDRGIEELEDRRGEEQVAIAWLAERLRDFVDLNPDFELAIDRLASWLARLDDEEALLSRTAPAATNAICLDCGRMRYIVRCSGWAFGKDGWDGTLDR